MVKLEMTVSQGILPLTFARRLGVCFHSLAPLANIPLVLNRKNNCRLLHGKRTTQSRVCVEKLCRSMKALFNRKGIPEAQQSAELIIASVLGKQTLHAVPGDKTLTKRQLHKCGEMYQQRLLRKPVQYIIGEWDFCGLTLKMKEPVFIPRPETEDLVGLVAMCLADTHMDVKLLEFGCGSGAISLALLKQCPQMHAVAVDKLEAACMLTVDNARLIGVEGRLTVVQMNIFSLASHIGDLLDLTRIKFDIMVSNPPYIKTADIPHLESEIFRFEHHDALDGGKDGLDAVRAILKDAGNFLKTGGHIWLEVDLSHPEMVAMEVADHPEWNLCYMNTWPDFSGRGRFCQLRYHGDSRRHRG